MKTLSAVLALVLVHVVACASRSAPPPPPTEPVLPNPCPAGGPTSAAVGNPTAPEFDRDVAFRAMTAIDLGPCAKKEKGASGCAQVQVQFEPNGNASAAWACETTLSPAMRACIEKRFKSLSLPPFRDRPALVRKQICLGGAK